MQHPSNLHTIIDVRVAPQARGDQVARISGVLSWRSPRTKRTSAGTSRKSDWATVLSATFAGVSRAAMGNQTPATTETTCRFHPETHPCQPALVQCASGS
ncbi:MAG TPA: hypothetical protein VFV38_42115, partial [Ktedonobacteraceae bacterium]|nr:hypothetical protein [Ktedonobacteraceae bacterium]